MPSIAYLGPAGTYSESAALLFSEQLHALQSHAGSGGGAEHDDSEVALLPYPTIPQALRSTASGETDYAVVPVENSMHGSVTFTLDSLWQLDGLQIQLALVLPVHHALITHANRLEAIQVVYSHSQSLAQCQQWLEKNLPHAQLIPTHSNTGEMSAVADNPFAAAIAAQRAAALYQLPILACPINDRPDNCTRFWVLSKSPSVTGTHTSLAFSVNNVPGALVQPLAVFADRGINLSRIESRPSQRSLGDYIFFIDIEAALDDSKLQAALEDLTPRIDTLKIMGSYEIA